MGWAFSNQASSALFFGAGPARQLIAMELLEKCQIITHVEKSLNYTVFGVKWIPSSAKVVVLGSHPKDTGALQIYELSKGELKLVLEVRFS